ncbi:hypothetical protein LQL77_07005 [Rhodococcus cerastii]|nr:hypothetical protein [Rhodococcus cerastii]
MSTAELVDVMQVAERVRNMAFPVECPPREADYQDMQRLNSGRSCPRGEAFSSEWDVVPEPEARLVLHISRGLNRPARKIATVT